jgi:hypothetical protein
MRLAGGQAGSSVRVGAGFLWILDFPESAPSNFLTKFSSSGNHLGEQRFRVEPEYRLHKSVACICKFLRQPVPYSFFSNKA